MSARNQKGPCTNRIGFSISKIQVSEKDQEYMRNCYVRLKTVLALGAACCRVKAELLDRSGAVIAGGYYIHCGMQTAPEDRNRQ